MFRLLAPFQLLALKMRRDRNARLTREALERRNLARFRRLAAFLAQRSPYYARVMRERGIDPRTARPDAFPVLTKRLLNDHFDEIATDPAVRRDRIEAFLAKSHEPRELFDGRFHVIHSTGTSGEVSFAAFSRREWLHAAVQFERLIRLGRRKRIAYVGVTHGHRAGVSLALASSPGWTGAGYAMRPFDIRAPRDRMIRELNEYRPRILAGYARALVNLAAAQIAGELAIAPRAVLCGGEALSPGDKRMLWHAFETDIRNLYACSEHLYVGFNLPHDPGMYLLEDDLILEPREDCTLVTNLFNRTVPLVRHRLGDVLEPPPADAGSYGPYRIVGGVVGRAEHSPRFLDAAGEPVTVNSHLISGFFEPGLRAWQFVQLDDTSFRFRVVLGSPERRNEILDAIRRHWRDLLAKRGLENVRLDVEVVDALEPDPETGKFQLVLTPK